MSLSGIGFDFTEFLPSFEFFSVAVYRSLSSSYRFLLFFLISVGIVFFLGVKFQAQIRFYRVLPSFTGWSFYRVSELGDWAPHNLMLSETVLPSFTGFSPIMISLTAPIRFGSFQVNDEVFADSQQKNKTKEERTKIKEKRRKQVKSVLPA